MKKKKRLIWQLYPSYLLITLISLIAITWYASNSLRSFFHEQTASDLEARAHLFEAQILDLFDPLDEKGIDELCKVVGKPSLTRITVILPSGKVVGDSEEDPATMDSHIDRPEVIQALRSSFGTSVRYSRTIEKDLMYAAVTLRKDSHTVAIIRTSIPVNAIDDALKDIQIKIAAGGLIIAVIAAILSLLISRRITRPIEQIKKWSEAIAQGEFQFRTSVPKSEEIAALSESMNQMAIELRDRIDTIMRQRNEIEAMLSSMAEGIIAVDMEEYIISMNNAAGRMLGCDTSEIQGRSIQEVIRNTDLQRFVARALSSSEPVEEDIVVYSEGELFLKGHGTILNDAEGRRLGALVVLNDITRLQRLENIRREFVANVSHEIKTPITAIKGFVETLRDGAAENPEEVERFLDIIGKHVDRLDTIIEDLLSLSRIEQLAEREEITLREELIKEVLQSAIQLCEVKATERDIGIELSCNENLMVKINSVLLEQAVVNLLDNAIKYSDMESVIHVEASKSNGELLINVRDQGCGIENQHLPRLFERFYRVDKARSRKQGGTGLGLAIVKHITQAHGGYVTVESVPGEGSTFSIHLPQV